MFIQEGILSSAHTDTPIVFMKCYKSLYTCVEFFLRVLHPWTRFAASGGDLIYTIFFIYVLKSRIVEFLTQHEI
jgi:hypothetical protein